MGEDGAEANKWKNRCKKDLGAGLGDEEQEGKGVMGHREVIEGLMRQRAKMGDEDERTWSKKRGCWKPV